ncbi:helix-turn-helix domain-containing protein [Prauserella endophytica]|uniref:Helix-turn-helix domain-containing protein n=1 Tax=Prauserella endophytica TaxID=1592324 RepID=A0ABY2SAT4_9PSEU|nr:helix-turn-helix transcriptional regulator [Prauserella endophytica]TKG72737.1 helix-turn-helix domain-containing protein [Prauserella endophytica]
MTAFDAAVARTPTGRRLQLAALCHHLRARAGLTQLDAARTVRPGMSSGVGQNKIARLERGDGGMREADLIALLRAYGAEDTVIELACTLRPRYAKRDRWGGPRAAYDTDSSRRYVDLEEDAASIRLLGSEMIPDLLACESYAYAALAGQPARLRRAKTDAILSRHDRVLCRQDPPEIYAVLSESCFYRRPPGPPTVLEEQLDHLTALAGQPNITVQVSTFGATPGVQDALTLLRLPHPVQSLDDLTFAWGRIGDDPIPISRIEACERLWSSAVRTALRPADSLRFLHEFKEQR